MSSNTIVSGFKVPDYGTAECNTLQSRFTSANGYTPSLPASGKDSAGNTDCIMQPSPSGTGGTQISYLGFSNEDRSSFLLKWAAGFRLTDRWFVNPSDKTTYCDVNCPRLYADFTVGQDEAFTRGKLRHFLFKADARIPIEDTGLYFFASAANRFERNSTLSPLILSPVTLSTNTASTTCAASKTTVCFPASNVLILPYKQPDRDYYRIGIAIDAMKVLTKLFTKQKASSNDSQKASGEGPAPQQPAWGGGAPVAQPPAGGSALLAKPAATASGR